MAHLFEYKEKFIIPLDKIEGVEKDHYSDKIRTVYVSGNTISLDCDSADGRDSIYNTLRELLSHFNIV